MAASASAPAYQKMVLWYLPSGQCIPVVICWPLPETHRPSAQVSCVNAICGKETQITAQMQMYDMLSTRDVAHPKLTLAAKQLGRLACWKGYFVRTAAFCLLPPFPNMSNNVPPAQHSVSSCAHWSDLSTVCTVDGYNGYTIAMYPAETGCSACITGLAGSILRWDRRAISGAMTNIQASSVHAARARQTAQVEAEGQAKSGRSVIHDPDSPDAIRR